MANTGYRQIHPEMWDDPFILDLSPEEKLLFIYMFSNNRASLSGLYEISRKQIVYHTGLSDKFVNDTLDKFVQSKKIVMEGNFIFVVNLLKRHFSKSPKVFIRVQNDIKCIPDCEPKRVWVLKYKELIGYQYSTDTQSHEDKDVNKDKDVNEDKDEDLHTDQPFSQFSRVFQKETGLPDMSGGVPRYIKSINAMIEMGAEPEDLKTAIKELGTKEYQIVSPGSCINAVRNVMNKRKNKPKSLAELIQEA